jgi:hypothetical protein
MLVRRGEMVSPAPTCPLFFLTRTRKALVTISSFLDGRKIVLCRKSIGRFCLQVKKKGQRRREDPRLVMIRNMQYDGSHGVENALWQKRAGQGLLKAHVDMDRGFSQKEKYCRSELFARVLRLK